jgi:hypothetical protein
MRKRIDQQYIYSTLKYLVESPGASNFTVIYFVYLADREWSLRRELRDGITRMYPELVSSSRLRFLEVWFPLAHPLSSDVTGARRLLPGCDLPVERLQRL